MAFFSFLILLISSNRSSEGSISISRYPFFVTLLFASAICTSIININKKSLKKDYYQLGLWIWGNKNKIPIANLNQIITCHDDLSYSTSGTLVIKGFPHEFVGKWINPDV